MDARVEGLDTFLRTLDAAMAELADPTSIHQAMGAVILPAAVASAPRRTGALANSHEAVETPTSVVVSASAPYARPVHAHNPWLARAFAATEAAQVDAATDSVAQTIHRIHGK